MRKQLVSRSKSCLSNVLGHATQLEIERGEGSYLYDYSGHAYLDFGAGIAVNATGHCHPAVVNAIKEQSEKLLHGCAGVIYYEQNIQLLNILVTLPVVHWILFFLLKVVQKPLKLHLNVLLMFEINSK